MTLYWYNPCGVTKAEISLVCSVNRTCQNPFLEGGILLHTRFSNFVDKVIHSWNREVVCLGHVVHLSVICALPSGLGTSIHGELQLLLFGSIKSFSSKYFISFLRYCCLLGFRL